MNPESPLSLPFVVGQLTPESGYVHVVDDETLTTLMSELDTVADFTSYLESKEQLVVSGHLEWADSEEDLLAVYLTTLNIDGSGHGFPNSPDGGALRVASGAWSALRRHPQYIAKKKAEAGSYLWDEVINEISKHAIEGTLLGDSQDRFPNAELTLRYLAREDRLHRRGNAKSLLYVFAMTGERRIYNRTILSDTYPDTAIVLQAVSLLPGLDHHKYREFRRVTLEDYCKTVALRHRHLKRVVGLTFEGQGPTDERSYDLVLFEPGEWTPELVRDAETAQQHWGFFNDKRMVRWEGTDEEYPPAVE